MISEMAGVAGALVLGWALLRPFSPVTGFAFIAAAAFPIGVAAWVAATAAFQAILVPLHAFAGLLIAVIVAALVQLYWRLPPTRRECLALVAGNIVVLSVASLFAFLEWDILIGDALWTFYMADDLVVGKGFFSDGMRMTRLTVEPVYLPYISAYAKWFGETYFVSFSALIIACTGALFWIMIKEGRYVTRRP